MLSRRRASEISKPGDETSRGVTARAPRKRTPWGRAEGDGSDLDTDKQLLSAQHSRGPGAILRVLYVSVTPVLQTRKLRLTKIDGLAQRHCQWASAGSQAQAVWPPLALLPQWADLSQQGPGGQRAECDPQRSRRVCRRKRKRRSGKLKLSTMRQEGCEWRSSLHGEGRSFSVVLVQLSLRQMPCLSPGCEPS